MDTGGETSVRLPWQRPNHILRRKGVSSVFYSDGYISNTFQIETINAANLDVNMELPEQRCHGYQICMHLFSLPPRFSTLLSGGYSYRQSSDKENRAKRLNIKWITIWHTYLRWIIVQNVHFADDRAETCCPLEGGERWRLTGAWTNRRMLMLACKNSCSRLVEKKVNRTPKEHVMSVFPLWNVYK